MPKHKNRVTFSDRLARRNGGPHDQKRLNLLEEILDESSSIGLNDVTSQTNAKLAIEKHSHLLELIDELRQVESSLNTRSTSRSEESWLKFFNWIDSELSDSDASEKLSSSVGVARKKDVCESALEEDEFGDEEDEFSLVAKVPFKQGDNIFGVHRRVMLSTESVSRDIDLYDFIKKDSIASSMQNVVLVLHLLNECSKGNKSFWAPYLSILPNKILPVLTLTKDKLEHLLPSAHLFEALKMIRAISRQYSYFFKRLESTNLPLARDFTFQYYVWGVSIVCSRQNEIPPINRKSGQAGVVHALIPILDMCNHDPQSSQAIFEACQTQLTAPKDLNIGDEITINYGSRTSGEFYIHNGFVPEQVPFDVVPLTIVLNKQEPLFESRVKLLKTLNMPPFGKFRLTRNDHASRHKRDPHLTMFLIVYLMNEAELNLILESDNPVGIADEIYEYVQYNQSAIKTKDEGDDVANGQASELDIAAIKDRLATSVKEYLSKRSAVGVALINRILTSDECQIDRYTSRLLKHECSIYESHLINCKAE